MGIISGSITMGLTLGFLIGLKIKLGMGFKEMKMENMENMDEHGLIWVYGDLAIKHDGL